MSHGISSPWRCVPGEVRGRMRPVEFFVRLCPAARRQSWDADMGVGPRKIPGSASVLMGPLRLFLEATGSQQGESLWT